MKQHTVTEIIGPEIAKYYLEFNGNNRRLRPSHVKALAYDMKNGHWQVTHQGIAFDDTGRLIDGQHRLHAIVEAGVAVQMPVTRGCNASAFSIIDTGSKRTPSDITGWSQAIAAVASLAVRIAYGTNPTISRIKLMDGSDLIEKCRELLGECPTTRTIFSSASVRLAACTQMSIAADPKEPSVLTKNWYFVVDQYKALIFQHYDKMTKCSQSFVRQSQDKMDREELFCRAMVAFDASQANSQVRMTLDAKVGQFEIVRKIVKQHISK